VFLLVFNRVVIYVDGGYLDKALERDFSSARIDLGRFSDLLLDPHDELIRTYYYTCPPYQSSPPTQDERRRKSRYDSFRHNIGQLDRFEIREGELKRRTSPFGGRPIYIQKGVDTLLCVDLLSHSLTSRIDKAILVAGDKDLIPGVKAAKEAMTIMKLVYSAGSISDDLYDICDERLCLTLDVIEKVVR